MGSAIPKLMPKSNSVYVGNLIETVFFLKDRILSFFYSVLIHEKLKILPFSFKKFKPETEEIAQWLRGGRGLKFSS